MGGITLGCGVGGANPPPYRCLTSSSRTCCLRSSLPAHVRPCGQPSSPALPHSPARLGLLRSRLHSGNDCHAECSPQWCRPHLLGAGFGNRPTTLDTSPSQRGITQLRGATRRSAHDEAQLWITPPQTADLALPCSTDEQWTHHCEC